MPKPTQFHQDVAVSREFVEVYKLIARLELRCSELEVRVAELEQRATDHGIP